LNGRSGFRRGTIDLLFGSDPSLRSSANREFLAGPPLPLRESRLKMSFSSNVVATRCLAAKLIPSVQPAPLEKPTF
jgi:hypothetical protein